MNKKVVILAIFVVYLLTIAVITAIVIAGKKEFKPAGAAKQIRIKEISSRDFKKEANSGAGRLESPAPAAAEEKEFEPPIEGPLAY
ncbi:MAG: hypothetical protein WC532_01335 [Candidatus Omnitrophota bacterium]